MTKSTPYKLIGFFCAVMCVVSFWSYGWHPVQRVQIASNTGPLGSSREPKIAGPTDRSILPDMRRQFESQVSFDAIQTLFNSSSNTTVAPARPVQPVDTNRSEPVNVLVTPAPINKKEKTSTPINKKEQIPSSIEKKEDIPAPIDKKEETHDCGKPKHNIVFFKMHKCSSSTIQNILMRYGDEHDLNFVLPPAGNYLGHDPFTRRAMFNFGAKEYNILCHHTRFNYAGMSEVMPMDSVWTSIIRDPVAMFESSFYYRGLHNAFRLASNPDPLAAFSLDPQSYLSKYGNKNFGRSPMLYDLGISNELKGNVDEVKKFISKLDGYFDFVLLTEYFEESLILFKELMCWDLDDIVHFVVNARAKTSVHTVKPEVRERLKKWNFGDVMLYENFNRTFWKKVEAFGVDRMRREVALLKERNRELKERCILDPEKTINQGGIWHPGGVGIQGLVVKPGMENDVLCTRMARPELKYTAYLLTKQKKIFGFT